VTTAHATETAHHAQADHLRQPPLERAHPPPARAGHLGAVEMFAASVEKRWYAIPRHGSGGTIVDVAADWAGAWDIGPSRSRRTKPYTVHPSRPRRSNISRSGPGLQNSAPVDLAGRLQ
jgi:hypothetical protein